MTVDGHLGLVGWLLDPDLILTLLLLNLLVAGVRLCSTTHAWLVAGGRMASLGLLTVLAVVAVPHVALGIYGVEARATLSAVFPDEPQPSPVVEAATSTRQAPTTTVATTTTASTETSTDVRGILPIPELAIPTTTTAPATTTTTLPLGTERFTVLLLGGDSGPGRGGLRTDAMIVASLNTLTGDAALFGLPRNMGGLSLSDGSEFPGLSRGMLNEVYQWGRRNPERFGGIDPGATAVSDVVSTLLGIPIDHFVLIEMIGFAELIDVLGGVTMNVPHKLQAPLYDRSSGGHSMITIPAGEHWLDGDLALAYSRTRTGSNDYARMGRQRCLLSSLAAQLEPLRLFARFTEVLNTIENRVTTDIPLSKIPFIVKLAPNLDMERTIIVGFDRDFWSGRTSNGLPTPDVPKIQAEVQHALAAQMPEGSGLSVASGACST